MLASVIVKIQEGEDAVIVGRDGESKITAIKIETCGSPYAFIDGLGALGKEIRGGFAVPVEVIDKLCLKWLFARM